MSKKQKARNDTKFGVLYKCEGEDLEDLMKEQPQNVANEKRTFNYSKVDVIKLRHISYLLFVCC